MKTIGGNWAILITAKRTRPFFDANGATLAPLPGSCEHRRCRCCCCCYIWARYEKLLLPRPTSPLSIKAAQRGPEVGATLIARIALLPLMPRIRNIVSMTLCRCGWSCLFSRGIQRCCLACAAGDVHGLYSVSARNARTRSHMKKRRQGNRHIARCCNHIIPLCD